ncbi:hypothetical protein GGR56DRAFT_678741 [Xylariaceae sp. FL0804]|nr:hypothetical protein GGR56DRAFT_678741 [Xylariaceae sp. FL0804]
MAATGLGALFRVHHRPVAHGQQQQQQQQEPLPNYESVSASLFSSSSSYSSSAWSAVRASQPACARAAATLNHSGLTIASSASCSFRLFLFLQRSRSRYGGGAAWAPAAQRARAPAGRAAADGGEGDRASLYRLSQTAGRFLRLSFDAVFEADAEWRAFRHIAGALSDRPRRRLLPGAGWTGRSPPETGPRAEGEGTGMGGPPRGWLDRGPQGEAEEKEDGAGGKAPRRVMVGPHQLWHLAAQAGSGPLPATSWPAE